MRPQEGAVRFTFGDFELDDSRFELRHRGRPVAVQPQVFDVLRHLIEHADRVVTKEELLDTVWGDRFVSESTLTSRVKAARQAVHDDGRRQAVIRTVHSRGYQFVAPCERHVDEAEAPLDPGTARALPRPVTSFVGRETDVAGVLTALGQHRIVTVAGAGGIGKTRLALEVGLRAEQSYEHGVHVVELASLPPDEDVVGTVASDLGVKARSGVPPRDRVVEALVSRRLLLVLDNGEHVAASVSALATALASRTSGVDVLVTSRQPLAVDGEHLWTLSPLPLWGEDGQAAPAEILLRDRLTAVLPPTSIDPFPDAVAEICRELDGVPLFLELAAARARHIGLHGVRDALADPSTLVASHGGTRHRSLETVVGWSFDRLGPAEQELFAALSVFAGWFDPEGATAVVDGDAAPSLWRLVDESLVDADTTGPAPRHRLLVPLRAFARSVLEHGGQAADVRRRHARYVTARVTAADRALRGPRGGEAMRTLASLVPEVRVAYRTLVESGDWSGVADLLGPLYVFAQEHVRGDVFSLMGEAADQVPADRAGALLAGSAVAAWQQGDPDTARRLARRAVDRSGDGPGGRFARLALGQVDELDGALTDADVHGAEAARLAAIGGDPLIETVGLVMRALVSAHAGDLGPARDHAARAAACADGAGCPLAEAWAAYAAGEIELEERPTLAAAWLDRALARATAAGSPLLRGIALLSSVTLQARRGDDDGEAVTRRRFRDLVDHWQLSGMWAHQWATLRNLVAFLGQTGDVEDAARLYGAVTGPGAAFAAHGAEASRLERTATDLRQALGDDRFDALTADGASRSAVEVLDLAFDIVGRGAS